LLCFGCILGVNPGIQDNVYNEQKKQAPVRQKHILEKSSNSYFFRDDQTTTGTHKQSLVIKPDYFKEGFEYIIKVQARFKGNFKTNTVKPAHVVTYI
jgi:hypothetical protein